MRACLACACAVFVLVSTRLHADEMALQKRMNPAEGKFTDEWMTVDMLGQRVGYAHQEMTRVGEEVQTSMLMSFSLKRLNTPVTFTQVQTTRESVDGKPRGFSNRMDASIQKLDSEGVIEGGKVRIKTMQYGQTTSQDYDFPPGAMLGWGAAREVFSRGFKPGLSYTLPIYEAALTPTAALEMKVQVVGPEEIDWDGKKVTAIRTEQSMKMPNSPMDMPSTVWYSPEGDVYRMSMNIGGISAVMTRSTKAKALEEFPPAEFFAPTLVSAGRYIDRAKSARIVYLLKPKLPGATMPPMPDTSMQKVLEGSGTSVRLAVQKLDHQALRLAPAAKDADREYLSANAFLNTEDPEIKAMAKVAQADATTPYAIADNLRRYVTEVIAEKGMDVAFATASEVCRQKEGDCTEHSVLLAALGRACGLPSRVAAGLVYVPQINDQKDVFGFHMWTQFLIGDTWVDFDAAQDESDCSATHIAFALSSLNDASLGQLVYGLVGVLGNLELKIEDVTLKD
jgi:hypothetical protein